MKGLSLYILIVIAFLATQCNSNTEYISKHSFDSSSWAAKDVQEFSFAIEDTSATHNLILKLTNNDDYPMANLYMFTNTILPDKTYFRDTIEFFLSNPKGEWTGSGWSSHTNTFNFRTGVKFPLKGEYTLSFEQAMRCRNEACTLEGLESIELILEKN